MASTKLQFLVTFAAAVTAAALLVSRGRPPACSIDDAIWDESLSETERSLKWGVSANGRFESRNMTPLELAIEASVTSTHWADMNSGRMEFVRIIGGTAVVQRLLDGGADANARDPTGSTPLHRAARLGHAGVAALLIDHGADITATDNNGKTPLALAGDTDVADLLRQHGATE